MGKEFRLLFWLWCSRHPSPLPTWWLYDPWSFGRPCCKPTPRQRGERRGCCCWSSWACYIFLIRLKAPTRSQSEFTSRSIRTWTVSAADMFNKRCRLIEWVLDTFASLFVRRQEAAKDAKQKAALSPEDSEESPNAAQVFVFSLLCFCFSFVF